MKDFIKKVQKGLTNKFFLSIIMVCFSYYVICDIGVIKTYDVISWIIFFCLIILFLKTDIFCKKMKKETIIFSILFAFIIVFGDIVYNLQYSTELSVFKELLTIKSLIKFIGVFNLLFIILKNLLPKLYDCSLSNKKTKIKKSSLLFIISFAVILLSWVPYYLTFFPGTLSPDSFGELGIIVNNFSSISDHHPVLHVLFIALPYNIGFNLFGTMTAGIALATIFQMIILASIFSSLIVFLYNRKVNDFILLIIILFYALVPMHGYYSIVMWKDVMFSGMLLLLTMQLVKILEKEKLQKLTFKSLIGFIIISILCVFFRNNAIYMYAILAIITLIMFKRYWKIFVASFCIVFAVYFIVKGPIFNYFNVKKSASAEYIGMPLQQVGRMAFKNVQFTEEEKKLIDKLIPVEIMAVSYNPKVSDGIKFNDNYNGDVFDKNKGEYLKLYLNLVKKYPSIALEAYSISTLGYWYPGVEYWSVANNIWENYYGIKTESKTSPFVKSVLTKLESRSTPILNIEWSIGLCFWIILIFGTITVKKNGLKGLYPFVAIFGIWLTMMVASPVFGEFRYVYGAYTCLPLLILCPYIIFKNHPNEN